jgi:glycosyltransferase involved in cell wall biosynthesis
VRPHRPSAKLGLLRRGPLSSTWSEEGHRVTTLELFFDLAYVFAIAQVSALMVAGHDAAGIVRGATVLALLWWSWASYSWLANHARADSGWIRATLLVGMTAVLVAGAVPDDSGTIRLAIGRSSSGGKMAARPEPGEDDKDAVLRDSHLLLHTSVREGWGLNVIEANAMGTPAAVYPVAGLRESTLHDRTGVVAARETPAALAEEIVRLATDDARYQRYRHGAWERAKTMHWRRILPAASAWFEARARGEPLRPEVIPS